MARSTAMIETQHHHLKAHNNKMTKADPEAGLHNSNLKKTRT
jgi:hypothetical protein